MGGLIIVTDYSEVTGLKCPVFEALTSKLDAELENSSVFVGSGRGDAESVHQAGGRESGTVTLVTIANKTGSHKQDRGSANKTEDQRH